VPHTRQELRSFMGVSITAGIVEEIVYRGFVLWYLGLYMPLWLAIVVSSLAFGLAHSYQGPSGALRCGLVGLVFGIFYVMTGSIWLPIIGHVLLDALQGLTTREILREDGSAVQPQPA
jgi:membrane protease YdiL (CAAX protease family)